MVDNIDVALLNAGLAAPKFSSSEEGWEMAVQVNVLSTALMALLLLPKLGTTGAARRSLVHVTFVNSIVHADVKREWFKDKTLLTAANDRGLFDVERNYSMVKLLAMAAIRGVTDAAVKERYGGLIVVNSCCPSLCKTDLRRKFGIGRKVMMMGTQALLARTAEQGSRTLVSATALGQESWYKLWSHDVLYP